MPWRPHPVPTLINSYWLPSPTICTLYHVRSLTHRAVLRLTTARTTLNGRWHLVTANPWRAPYPSEQESILVQGPKRSLPARIKVPIVLPNVTSRNPSRLSS